jgi:hypothetical protein
MKVLTTVDLLALPNLETPPTGHVGFGAKSDGLYQKIGTTETKLSVDGHTHSFASLTGIPATFTPSAHTLGSHSDVAITSNSAGEILKWDGSKWINNTLAEAGIAAASHNHSGVYQPLDADLTSIAGLADASTGFLRKTAANTWSLDNTNYTPILSGITDLNNISGLYSIFYSAHNPENANGVDWAQGLQVAYAGNPNYKQQLMLRGDALYRRGQSNGTWYNWAKVWDSGNFTNLNQLTTRNFSDLQNKPTTLSGYSITASDVLTQLKTVDGAGSGLDADLLDGVHNGYLTSNFINYNNSPNGYGGVQFMQMSTNNDAGDLPSDTWYTVMKMNHDNGDTYYNRALAFEFFGDGIYTRRVGGVAYDWKQIAFTDSNVASATKLQTARTIWGQSFDGTGNVSGDITIGSASIRGTAGQILFAGNFHIDSIGTNALYLNYYNGTNTIINSGTSQGNVGIGTTTPAYKLDVNGTGRFTSGLTAQSLTLSGALTGATTIAASTSITTPKHDLGNGWALVASGSEVQMQYNGAAKMRFLSDGSIVAVGEVTAYGATS